MKVVPALSKTANDSLVEGAKPFIEQFFQRRVRLRCDGEPATVALAEKMQELVPGLVVLETTPRPTSQAKSAERAITERWMNR